MKNTSFLQSRNWEQFQNSLGRATFRIDDKLIIKHKLPMNFNYFYSPRPYFKSESDFSNFSKEAKNLAQKENCIFLRLEPDLNSTLHVTRYALHDASPIQPQDTLILNLQHSEETLLKEMHPKTRYNIRVAEKHEIKIEKTTDPEKIDIFYDLALKTGSRDNFSFHPRAYYKQMLKVLGKDKMVELYIAYAKIQNPKSDILNKSKIQNSNFSNNTIMIPTAAILVMFYKDTAIYLHGASDHEYRNSMSPYLLQWEAIKEAKKRGCKNYDFWGIAPQQVAEIPISKLQTPNNIQKPKTKNQNNTESHPWNGITRFKTGFAPNGQKIHYPDSLEIVYQKIMYNIYNIAKKVM